MKVANESSKAANEKRGYFFFFFACSAEAKIMHLFSQCDASHTFFSSFRTVLVKLASK
jgi:hypothetical protein